MSSIEKVKNFYDDDVLREWERMDRHPMEFGVTLRYMDKYYPKGASILDVGGGPGRYAIHLAKKGHDVTLVDLSPKNVEFAKEMATKEGVKIDAFNENALNLKDSIGGKYDIVQCMGPLYHLMDENDRISVVRQCLDLIKPNGLFVAAFISSYAFLLDIILHYPNEISNYKKLLLNSNKSSAIVQSEENPGFTDAYFTSPNDIAPFFNKFELDEIAIAGIEGIPHLNESALRELPKESLNDWIDIAYKMSQDKFTWASSSHFLYIGRKV